MQHTRSRGETTTPYNLAQLVGRDGTTRAAKALGVSTTTIHKARTTGEVSKVVEVAAAGLLKYAAATQPHRPDEARTFEPRAVVHEVPNRNPSLDTKLYLIEVPEAKGAIVERFAEALGAHVLSA